MLIDVQEKYDVYPQWFEDQARKDAREAWEERLCQLLSINWIKDETGAKEAAEKMKAAGISEELIRKAME